MEEGLEEIARYWGVNGGIMGVQGSNGLKDRGRNIELRNVAFKYEYLTVVECGQLSDPQTKLRLLWRRVVEPELQGEEGLRNSAYPP